MILSTATSINSESLSKSQTFSDIDYYRRYYTIQDKGSDGNTTVVRFVSPELDAFEKYRYPLLKNSTIKDLLPKYYYRPDYVSYEEYGTTNYWALLLFINNIPNIESFITDKIIVPTASIITTLSIDIEKVRTDLEIVPLSIRELSNTPLLYNGDIPKVLVNKTEMEENTLVTSEDIDYVRDTFTLTMTDILNRYVMLSHSAIAESVKLILPNEKNYVYNKHYAVIQGKSNKFNKLTWDPRKLTGKGLMDIMKEKLTFDVTYVKRENN